MARRAAIVGVGQTAHKTARPDVNVSEMVNEAVQAALGDAGLTLKDVDAVLAGNMELFEGHYLTDCMVLEGTGAYLKHGMKLNTGGTVGATMAAAAFHHVQSGWFDTVLTIGFNKLDEGNTTAGITLCFDAVYNRPYESGAIGVLGLQAQTYLRESGCTEEHAALVRAKAGHNAARNPYAHRRSEYSVAEILGSRVVVHPLHVLEVCPESSGACALVVAAEGRAEKITKSPVWVKDCVTVHSEAFKLSMEPDPLPTKESYEQAAIKLFKRNGISRPREEIDVVELYEPTSWSELYFSELAHLFEPGEAWKAAERGDTSLNGSFPINPSGGVVCTNPIGATAMIRIAEATLQVRGDADERQVAREVNQALATGWGGHNWTVMTLLTKSR